jgi:hypothetical protein
VAITLKKDHDIFSELLASDIDSNTDLTWKADYEM